MQSAPEITPEGLHADWPAPLHVRTLVTTRLGGYSQAPFSSFNLASHVGDDPEHVRRNRERLRTWLPADPCWLNQVHGTTVVRAETLSGHTPEADGALTEIPHTVCAVLTADCLPILLTDYAGSIVAACHAGWRGLCHGILEATCAAMRRHPTELLAWLGPAISGDAFEVGDDVRTAFIQQHTESASAFTPIGPQKYLADLYELARQRLTRLGITAISGGQGCTVIERERFFSYRRDGVTGRMASLIWLDH